MPTYTVLVLEDSYASSVAVTVDALRAAARLAPRLGLAAPTWSVASAYGGPVELQGGLSVDTTGLPRRRDPETTWVVPGLGTETEESVLARLDREDVAPVVRALRRHGDGGGRIAAGCSAVFLLERAGLLDGRTVTTTWWLAPALAARAAGCTVDADRMVCADGPVVTAGAAFAQTDLMLHLLRTYGGARLSDLVARTLLVDARHAQSPYVVPELLANGDALVTRIVGIVEERLPDPPTVAGLAAELAVSERTLARQVARACGLTPLALVQSVKLRRARTLLESSRMPVEQVATAVGYRDATALRRAMRKAEGVTPSQYRLPTAPSATVAR